MSRRTYLTPARLPPFCRVWTLVTRTLFTRFAPIVSVNRPSVDLAPEPAERERFVSGAGGLVTGLSGLAQATGAVWVASVRGGFEGELELGSGGEPMMLETTDGSR